jgi:putative nucleotidyltransferase with HDIG domain
VHTPTHIHRRKALIAYTLGVAAAAVAIIVMTLPGMPPRPWADLVVFVSLVAISEYWTVPTGSTLVEGEMSPSFTVNFAAAVLFGPAFGALAGATGVLLSYGLARRRGLLKSTFNAGQIAIVVALTGLVFNALKAGPNLTLKADAVAFTVAAIVYLVVNSTLPTLFLAVCGRPVAHQLALLLREDGLFYIAMAPLGVLLALSYQQTRWSLLLFPFVMIVIYKGFKLFASLQTETNNAVVVLADTVDKRDPHTYQHSIRVAQHVASIAQRLNLSGRELEMIVSAARVHDLGKISTDNRILFKEGPLTEEERTQIKAHPADGAELAGQFSLYRKGCEYIRHHHERWDGKGYPDGLAGEAIPLGARIIAVADSFDAMTSDRPYRDALPREVAIEELKRCSGTQFDTRVVEAFLVPDEIPRQQIAPSAELAPREALLGGAARPPQSEPPRSVSLARHVERSASLVGRRTAGRSGTH